MTRALPPAVLALAVLGLVGLNGCSKSRDKAPPPGASAKTTIRFATDWRAEAEQGGFYEALANGEYARRGLDVRIIAGGAGANVPQLLATGSADLGIGSNSFGVMNLAAEHVPVKAVMAAFQKDPQVLIAHPNTGIGSMADMKGHPILLSDAAITSFWPWLKAKFGFTDAQVRKYTFSSAPFLADPNAVQEGYVTSEPYTIAKAAHAAPTVFLLADQGYPGYAAMVLAPDALIASNPKAVQAFVEASAVGWKTYLEGDPAPGDALILKANSEMTKDVLDQARAKMRQYGLVASGDAAAGGIGTMTQSRWKTFFDMASGLGVYPRSLDYHAAFTTAFTAALPFVALPHTQAGLPSNAPSKPPAHATSGGPGGR
jgi:NitT/TauT family transport system substrate-binding protein